jgi:GNAT superfamily N-acetyltransferase
MTPAPPLVDEAGTVLADVAVATVGEHRWTILTSRRAAAEVAPAALAQLSGHRVVTEDDDLVALLVAGGGRVQRRGHDYRYDLSAVPASYAEAVAPQGFSLSPGLDPAALVAAHALAYPPGHPDHEADKDHLDDLRSMVAGKIMGANVPTATWQVSGAEGPCGAVIVSERPPAEDGLTWVLDVFVHPRHAGRGIGGALLRRAVAGAASAGFRTLGLVVSDGNPARAAYEAVGFRLVSSATNVELP